MNRAITTCGAIILNSHGQILVLRRSKTDSRRPLSWDLPGGHSEPGETNEQTVQREVYEETGLTLTQPPRSVYSTSATFEDGTNVTWLFYIGQAQGESVALSSEHDTYKWASIGEAIDLVTYQPKQRALQYVQSHGLL